MRASVVCWFVLFIFYGCFSTRLKAYERTQRIANKMLVTEADTVPGHKVEMLGPVFSGAGFPIVGDMRGCTGPLKIAEVAAEQFGEKADAVIGFRISAGQCSFIFGRNICMTICKGTAAHYVDVFPSQERGNH